MKKFSKVLALGLAATMLGGVFVGCAGQTTPTPAEKGSEKPAEEAKPETPADEPAAPVTLRFVAQFGGTDPNKETFEKII